VIRPISNQRPSSALCEVLGCEITVSTCAQVKNLISSFLPFSTASTHLGRATCPEARQILEEVQPRQPVAGDLPCGVKARRGPDHTTIKSASLQ
jgi:hypothetical protein